MIGDSIRRDTAAPPLDSRARYGADQLYIANKRIPYVLVAQDLQPADKTSELNISNYQPVMVQQQAAAPASQGGVLSRLTSLNPKLAWIPQTNTGPNG